MIIQPFNAEEIRMVVSSYNCSPIEGFPDLTVSVPKTGDEHSLESAPGLNCTPKVGHPIQPSGCFYEEPVQRPF